MDEKTMVNDILNGTKSELTTYQGVISGLSSLERASGDNSVG